MKGSVFWDITPFPTRFFTGFLLSLLFKSEDGREMFVRNLF
jgi:hypothetical protein